MGRPWRKLSLTLGGGGGGEGEEEEGSLRKDRKADAGTRSSSTRKS